MEEDRCLKIKEDHYVYDVLCTICLEVIPEVQVYACPNTNYPKEEIPVARHKDGRIVYMCGLCAGNLEIGQTIMKEMINCKKKLIIENDKRKQEIAKFAREMKELGEYNRELESFLLNLRLDLQQIDDLLIIMRDIPLEERSTKLLGIIKGLNDVGEEVKQEMVKFAISFSHSKRNGGELKRASSEIVRPKDKRKGLFGKIKEGFGSWGRASKGSSPKQTN